MSYLDDISMFAYPLLNADAPSEPPPPAIIDLTGLEDPIFRSEGFFYLLRIPLVEEKYSLAK